MRFALLATSALVGVALTSYACSSSDPAPAAAPDAGGSTKPPTTSSSGESSSGGDTSSSSSSGSQSSSGAPKDGGESSGEAGTSSGTTISGTNIPDGGSDGAAGEKCFVESTQEVEPNNDEGTATALSGTPTMLPGRLWQACGRLGPGDTDVYKFTFTGNVANYSLKVNAKLTIKGKVDGKTYDVLNPGPATQAEAMPLVKDKPTVLTLTNATAIDYTLQMDVR